MRRRPEGSGRWGQRVDGVKRRGGSQGAGGRVGCNRWVRLRKGGEAKKSRQGEA